MPATHAGDLREQVTFQTRAAGEDALGQPSGAWANVPTDATVWAQVQPAGTRDVAAAAQMQAVADYRVTVRWRADVLPTWRVLWQGQALEIVGVPADPDGTRRWLVITCARGLRDGV